MRNTSLTFPLSDPYIPLQYRPLRWSDNIHFTTAVCSSKLTVMTHQQGKGRPWRKRGMMIMTTDTQLILQTVITGRVCCKLCIPFWSAAGITKCLERIRESHACYTLIQICATKSYGQQRESMQISHLPIWSRCRYTLPSRC